MKSSLISLALCSYLIVGCAGGLRSSHSNRLTPEEDSLLQHNWSIASQLADYDRYSWIATDSLLSYVRTPDSTQLQGYVVTGNGPKRKVVFGKLNAMCLQSAFEVSFEDGRIVSNVHPSTRYCAQDEPYIRFASMNKAREVNKAILDSADFPYNTYVLGGKDTLVVYLMPGATNGYYGFCGGVRTVVDAKDLSVIETRKLHRSALITKPPRDAAVLMRTSSLGVVPNEVDLAQTLIFKDLPNDHIIATLKYMFIFSWDKKRKNVSMEVLKEGLETSK